MLAVTAVIVDYTFKMFSTSYILQAEPPKRCETQGNLPHYSPFRRAWVR